MRHTTALLFLAIVAGVLGLSGYAVAAEKTENTASQVATGQDCPEAADAGQNATKVTTLPADHAETQRYRIRIDYPDLPTDSAALQAKLHEVGQAAKCEFMQSLPDPKQFPEFADRQLQLMLDFATATQTPRFISVREHGMSNTGGAHPIPVDAGYVYDRKLGKLITLDDLFNDPDKARNRLSQMARQALRQKIIEPAEQNDQGNSAAENRDYVENLGTMLDEGTQPTPENFAEYVLVAPKGSDDISILRLFFSTYQVAPYVYGPQAVDIAVDKLSDLLKPEYRNAFTEP